MIVHINGPFGVGKTTTARLLVKKLPHSIIIDPERIGFVLQRLTRVADYQDLKLWRSLTIAAVRLASLAFANVVVPMTVWKQAYREQLSEGFRRADANSIEIILLASKTVIEKRARSRRQADALWSLTHLDRCLDALSEPIGSSHIIVTDNRTPQEVASEVLSALGQPPLG